MIPKKSRAAPMSVMRIIIEVFEEWRKEATEENISLV